jgi:hypothetical protein
MQVVRCRARIRRNGAGRRLTTSSGAQHGKFASDPPPRDDRGHGTRELAVNFLGPIFEPVPVHIGPTADSAAQRRLRSSTSVERPGFGRLRSPEARGEYSVSAAPAAEARLDANAVDTLISSSSRTRDRYSENFVRLNSHEENSADSLILFANAKSRSLSFLRIDRLSPRRWFIYPRTSDSPCPVRLHRPIALSGRGMTTLTQKARDSRCGPRRPNGEPREWLPAL